MEIYGYTDGSAVASGDNKGKGGYGVYFPNLFGSKKAYSQGFLNTKTGRMEVMALYYAIKAMPKTSNENIVLKIFSDSMYVVKTFTESRIFKWEANSWTNSSGEVKNKDLWQAILKSLRKRPFIKLELTHINSHQIDKVKKEQRVFLLMNPHIRGNSMADKLADYKRHKVLLKSDKI